MDKNKQIEEMAKEPQINEIAKVIFERGVALEGIDFIYGLIGSDHFDRIARAIYNAGYRKIPEGAVVLTEGAYKSLSSKAKANVVKAVEIRKETAREILSRLHCYGDRDEALRRDLLNLADDYDVEVEE